MDKKILSFLMKLDQELAKHASAGETLEMYLIGRAALLLRFSLKISTKDVDIVKEHNPLEEKAVELFGKHSRQADKLGFYLELVSSGLPPLPHGFRQKSEDLPGDWKVIRPKLLETHDLAATKLKAFRAKDKQDIQALCDLGEIDPDKLRASLDAAFCWNHPKDDDADRDAAFLNLEMVCRYLQGEIAEL